jgi:O-antigen/teichoic acid export membrane protein
LQEIKTCQKVGVIAKQTVQSSIFSYLGVILGGINVAILYPRIFSEEQIGLINILLALSAIFAQFSSLGINGVTNYFFHYFKDKARQHNGFFNVIVIVSLIGFVGFLIVFGLFKDQILDSRSEDSVLLNSYGIYIVPLTFFTLTFSVLDIYAAVLSKSVIGTFLKDFVFRLVNLSLIVAFYYNKIDYSQFLFWYTAGLGMPPVVIILELIRKGHLFLKPPNKKLIKQHRSRMFSVGGFNVLSGFGDMLITYIDRYMVNFFLGLGLTGIYSITNYVGTLVQIPRRAMGKIATPYLADLWAKNDIEQLQKIYDRSGISQLVLGVYIFIGIWINIDSVFKIIPQNYDAGIWVVFFIGLSNVFSCFLGLGGLMIVTSRRYRVSTYFTFVLGIMVVLSNLIFLPLWGITGAAFASALSKFVYVSLNMVFLNFRLGIKSFGKHHFTILLAGLLSYFPVLFITPGWHWVVLLGIKSIAVTLLYVLFLKLFRVVPDFRKFIKAF